MSRYSLRETPRKSPMFQGMVENASVMRRKPLRKLDVLAIVDPELSLAARSLSGSVAARSPLAQKAARRRNVAPALTGSDDASAALVPGSAGKEVAGERTSNGNIPGRPASKGEIGHSAVVADASTSVEFGGTPGVLALMIGFPLLMWYMWLGAALYDGHFPTPAPGQSWAGLPIVLVRLAWEHAFPTPRVFAIYWTYYLVEVALFFVLPGVYAWGQPLPHEGGRQLRYWCNSYASLYATLPLVVALHFSGLFRLDSVITEFGPLLSAGIISGFAASAALYASAVWRGAQFRTTGFHIYDFFMGAELNPRPGGGSFDFKLFNEVRIPWFLLLLITCAAAARQYELYGYVAPEVVFLLVAHYIYANACAKGEELIVTTWDMYYEKCGFMFTFWTMAGVPLSYCHSTLYLAYHHPSEYRWSRPALVALSIIYLVTYWIWDTCNSQKNHFRAAERGQALLRRTFPQLPWRVLHNPRTIVSAEGHTILVDGWYAIARKINYTTDAFFAVAWGLICGFASPFPWFYSIFFILMILHRAHRDIAKCRAKYGAAWLEYERQVPYLFIPYVW